MKSNSWWIIALTIVMSCALHVGHGWSVENGPIREPVYESPRVYKDSNGKVVLKEFFEGLTVNRIEFFDPDTEELLYGVSLQDGRLDGKREGSAVGENDGPFDESGEVVSYKILTHLGKTVFVIRELSGELVDYAAFGGGMNNPLDVSIQLEKGRIRRANRKFILNNEVVDFRRNLPSDTYEEIYFHDDGSQIVREYKSGFLKSEAHSIPAEGGGNFSFYNSAHYLRGKLAFTEKNKFINKNQREEIAIYDARDNLVGKANPVFGEILYLREETVNGRKALQVIRLGQDLKEKVEAVKFEDE